MRWWQETDAGPLTSGMHPAGQHTPTQPAPPAYSAALRLLTLSAAALGALLGAGIAMTAFHYDGTHPINVFVVLGLTVALPGLLLIPTVLALLPLGPALERGLLSLSPLRAAASAIDQHLGMNLFAGPAAGHQYAKWFVISAAQWLAVAFYVGLVSVTLTLLVFTDLAFGWSSTISLSTDRVSGLAQVLATPWAAFAPGAVPSMELVEQSRFVRLADPPPDSVRLGGWWPFLFFCIVVYWLAPRMLVLILALLRRQVALRELLLTDPEVVGLLERLSHPIITPEARMPEATAPPAAPPLGQAPRDDGHPATGIIWNGAVDDTAAPALARAAGYVISGPCIAASSVAPRIEVPGGSDRLLILTKGWAPPMLEFHDFLEQLRADAPNATLIVVPANLDADGVDTADRDVWAASIAQAPTSRVLVAGGTG